MKRFLLIFFILACGLAPDAYAQVGMRYTVVQGDTIYIDVLPPARKQGRAKRNKGTEWRKYYKLVYNFNKVYPYALVGRDMMAQVDSTLQAEPFSKHRRNEYINQVEKELFRLFEKDIRRMTISQGFVLMRLVDRECGQSPYEIIVNYEGEFAARFWQLVAKVFSADLKVKYEPEGRDAHLEELVQIWDSGAWDNFYASIFWEYPEKTVIPTQKLSDPRSNRKR